MTNIHSTQTDVHVIYHWTYADASARTGATGFVAADIGKVARQSDNNSFWILTATTPTWLELGGGGGGDVTGPGSSTDNAIVRWDGASGDTVQDTPEVTVDDNGIITQTIEDAITAALTILMTLKHNSSGTPAAGFGSAIEMQGESSTTADQLLAKIAAAWHTATHASRIAQLELRLGQYGGEKLAAVLVGPYSDTAVEGNARGEDARDFQGYRNAATQVASGEGSTIGGGTTNTASGNFSVVPGGDANVASAESSLAAGYAAIADKYGQFAYANGFFTTAGQAQTSLMVARRSVTHSDANWYELFLNGSTDRMTIPTDTLWAFDILLVGATQGQAKGLAYKITGAIENDGGTTALKGTPTVTAIDESDDTDFDARVTADDTNDALLIEVQDSTSGGDTVRWVASVRTVEVTYAA